MDLKRIRVGGKTGRLVGSLALVAALAVTGGSWLGGSRQVDAGAPETAVAPGIASVALAGLPVQGQEVMNRIRQGGPFPHEKDGTVFGNRERLLPGQVRGFYREYTVPTPGLDHRGARRIVCGGERPRAPEACFYTDDHYSSFRLIVQ